MGIKAEDLRIGNWINYLGEHVVCDINTIYAISKVVQPSVLYQPIPLTEEWLTEKFTFNKTQSKMEWVKDGIRICFTTENRFVYPDSAHGWVYVDYVHDLQNLFKELKKTELTIK